MRYTREPIQKEHIPTGPESPDAWRWASPLWAHYSLKKHPNGWRTKLLDQQMVFPNTLRVDQRIARSEGTHTQSTLPQSSCVFSVAKPLRMQWLGKKKHKKPLQHMSQHEKQAPNHYVCNVCRNSLEIFENTIKQHNIILNQIFNI